jgi:hypothetical protein
MKLTAANSQELFRTYLDESEEHVAGLYVVGGFVAKAEVWDSFEPAWLNCLPAGVSCFHATDCFTGNNEFKGIPISQRVELLDKLTDVLVAHDVLLVGYGIDRRSYESVAPKAKNNEFLGNRYAAPLGGVVELACTAMGNPPDPTTIWEILDNGEGWECCSFFLERNEYSQSAERVIASMRVCRDLWFRDRIGPDKYGTKNGTDAIPLLQVGDLGAFLVAKHRAEAAEGRISWKSYYDKLSSAGRVYPSVVADNYSVKVLQQLHEELKQEAAQGKRYWDNI